MMRRLRASASLLPAASLLLAAVVGACAVTPPSGPTIFAAPGRGKSFDAFRADDYRCRGYATGANGPADPRRASVNDGVRSAVAGTALGAVAGTLLGAATGSAGAGAAFGAGSGLLVGSAIGAGNSADTQESLQSSYDRVYAQCMIAAGQDVSPPAVVVVTEPYPVYRPGYVYPPGYVYQPGYAYPPGYGYPRPY